MTRGARIALAVGILAGVGWIIMAWADVPVMPSYLAAWLFWMAVPLGALPLAMALEALDAPAVALLAMLRRTLLLLPVGALLAIPVLLRTAPLYRRPDLPDALPAAWMAPGFFIARAVVILVVLGLFAVMFSRAPRRAPRRGLAVLGLVLHVSLVSVAAVDWVLSLQPGLGSSAIGLLLIASQVGVASCLAVFVLAVGTRDTEMPAGLGMLLTVALAAWTFLHMIQYLVVWSANLPKEVTWYQARAPGLGGAMMWFAAAAIVVGLAVLPSGLARVPAVLASVAAMLLAVHLVETLWLVTPAFRGAFTLNLADILAMLGIGGLLVGLLLSRMPRAGRRHAAV